ncbi:adenylate cyclase type 2-like [Ylistrum balloti]|uniref:adenylate cyclase type 2-like n=1 Tax=Ylistrum balloti TaxID=509963 RepID=UPI002905B08C|nr:adenylate cyclase type 2-like [Ylistrum balloti]
MGIFTKNTNNPADNQLSKIAALSNSQLSESIIDMLILRGDGNRCQSICRGNPITNNGKRKQMVKMLAIVMIPILALLGITANFFVGTMETYSRLLTIRQELFLGRELGTFLRYFQRERDMSTLYASRIGPETKSRLLNRYIDTDSALNNLSSWPVSPNNPRPEFQTVDDFTTYLARHRYELDINVLTTAGEIAFYSDCIDVFIKWLYEAISVASSEAIWKSLVAYQEIIVTSENIGRERGYGITFYALGYFRNREEYLMFLESQDIANVTFKFARQLSEIAFNVYDKSLSDHPIVFENIRNMRYEIRSNYSPVAFGSLDLADSWDANMTFYQDVIRQVQLAIATEIDAIMETNAGKSVRNITVFSFMFGAFLLICPLVVFGVYSLTSQIQKYSISIATRTRALKQEKICTDTLLYQMLPKSVAERLKRSEEVLAETFQHATLFFGDIVGFTQISSSSSPLQVVNMLNKLFSCFDKRIEEHDVYKVETIGDAYMVVSGIPKPNGQQHAGEIATMALDLLVHVSSMKIPHIPGKKFQLRIGCHSGSVVAGVVGTKMPRYCLFGESVNVAAKMEALGRPSMIHISETTFDILNTLGGYVMEIRTDDGAKSDPVLMSAFKGIVRTYWLTHKEGFTADDIYLSSRDNTPESDDTYHKLHDNKSHNEDGGKKKNEVNRNQ